MARIKVTGYVDTDDLNEDMVDLDHPTGLTAEGFDDLNATLLGLSDVTAEVVPD
jgi:hypothetical protein